MADMTAILDFKKKIKNCFHFFFKSAYFMKIQATSQKNRDLESNMAAVAAILNYFLFWLQLQKFWSDCPEILHGSSKSLAADNFTLTD